MVNVINAANKRLKTLIEKTVTSDTLWKTLRSVQIRIQKSCKNPLNRQIEKKKCWKKNFQEKIRYTILDQSSSWIWLSISEFRFVTGDTKNSSSTRIDSNKLNKQVFSKKLGPPFWIRHLGFEHLQILNSDSLSVLENPFVRKIDTKMLKKQNFSPPARFARRPP